MANLTLMSPSGKLMEGDHDEETGTWTPRSGRGLAFKLAFLLDAGWTADW